MPVKRNAIIIGGGPSGLATALRLHQTTNIKCSVYELRPEPITMGGAVGILPNGLRLLDRLGIYKTILTRGSSHSTLFIHSVKGGILGQKNDTVGYARDKTGYGYVRIKRTDLMDVLLDAVHKANIPVHFNKRLAAIDDNEDGVTAIFTDGTTEKADLLLGCDGIHSCVRQHYVEPEKVPEYSGFSVLFSIMTLSSLPATAAAQLSGFDVTFTEEGMFAVMQCTAAADESYWFFSREVPRPDSGDSRDGWEVHTKEELGKFKSNLHRVLANASGEWGSALKQIVDNTNTVKFYPIYRLPPGGSWYKGRCLLLGDAAHAMPPHAGQGVSMAIEDTFLVSRLLENPDLSLNEVYERFEQIRRPRVDEIHKLTVENVEVRKKTGPWGLWVKEIMIMITMWLSWALGLDKIWLGQQYLVYDIDKVEL